MRRSLNQNVVCMAICWGVLTGSIASAEPPPAVAADAPRRSAVRLTTVSYVERADGPLAADVYAPEGEGPFPGVLLVHGGAWMMGNKSRMRTVGERLASSGMVAVSINYRLAPKHKFPAQLEDCQAAVGWMREHAEQYHIDPARIGAYGYSAGGHLVTLLAATAAQAESQDEAGQAGRRASQDYRLQAVVAGGAPCDFRGLPEDDKYLAFWLGGTRRQKGDLYRRASPREFVTPSAPPIFFFHAERDRIVPLEGARDMQSALAKAGVDADFYIVPGVSHAGAFFDNRARDRAVEFLSLRLRSDAGLEPTTPLPQARRN